MKLAIIASLIVGIEVLPLAVSAGSIADVDADADIVAARQAAHDDHNAQSAKLFEAAIAASPDRRLELLPELSDQLTYSGKSADAVPLYREAIASTTLSAQAKHHTELGLALALAWSHHLAASKAMYESVLAENPRDTNAMLGEARVLSWQDQLSPSLHEYEAVLRVDPGNLEARENIARVESWRGRRHAAIKDANAILAEHPTDRQAKLIRAQTELWMGRPDLASSELGGILAEHQLDASAFGIKQDVLDAGRSQFDLTSSVGTQSDGLIIRTNDVSAEFRGWHGLTSVGVRYQPISYTGLDNAGDATEGRIGLFARARLNDYSEVNASVGNDDIAGTDTTPKDRLLYNTYATFWPNDYLRFDIGSRRETFDNLTSLRLGLTAVYNSLSVDVTPDESTRFTARALYANVSDGNRQTFEQVEFERAVVRQPRLSFGLQATNYAFAQTLYNGYFDPPHYKSLAATTHLFGNIHSRLYYDVAGTYGREFVTDGGARPTHSQHGELSYVLSRPLSVSFLYDAFDTLQVSNGGFARTVFGFRFNSKW